MTYFQLYEYKYCNIWLNEQLKTIKQSRYLHDVLTPQLKVSQCMIKNNPESPLQEAPKHSPLSSGMSAPGG